MSEEIKEAPATERVGIVSDGFSSLALIGDITEVTSNEIIYSLLMLSEKQTNDYLSIILNSSHEELEQKDLQELKPSINFYISTNGGSADEMFGIYDVIRMIKDTGVSSVSTIGVGKVMSAGVLLLASGTRGERRVGRNCRIMLHSVIGGSTGPMYQLENEFAEVKKIQDTYIKALCEETAMTEKYLRNLLKKKTNIYLTAEEAVELGIADEVF